LRTRRRLLDLTQAEVARACGTGFRHIQKYEAGAAALSASRPLKIAAALQDSPADLLMGLGPSPALSGDHHDAGPSSTVSQPTR
jgi:transcriptional regulator with XRE-family HTH domain